jgi:hypothetical protein
MSLRLFFTAAALGLAAGGAGAQTLTPISAPYASAPDRTGALVRGQTDRRRGDRAGAEGARRVWSRVLTAAQAACGEPDQAPLDAGEISCLRQSVHRALIKLNDPWIAALAHGDDLDGANLDGGG